MASATLAPTAQKVLCTFKSLAMSAACHLALGLGDVRTTLEKVGRQSRIERGRLSVQFFRREVKIRRRFSEQHRDGILSLFALLLEQNRLRFRGVEQGLFLGDVKTGGQPAGVARFDELQAFLERVDRAIQDVQLGIELAERE